MEAGNNPEPGSAAAIRPPKEPPGPASHLTEERGPMTARGMTYDEQLIQEGVCPEIVPVWTEDGPSDGRCLAPVVPGGYACQPHTEAIEAWRAMSEAERAHWERQHDEF